MTDTERRALKRKWGAAVYEWHRHPTPENRAEVERLGRLLDPRFDIAEASA